MKEKKRSAASWILEWAGQKEVLMYGASCLRQEALFLK